MSYTRFELGSILETDYAATVERALARVEQASLGKLRDFSPHSPVTALVEGLVFVCQELRGALNEIPLNTLLRIYDTYGAGVNAGSPSVGTVEVTLSAPSYAPMSIAPGWRLLGGGLEFVTTAPLFFAEGAVSATVPIQCTQLGYAGNLPAGTVNGISQNSVVFANVASVNNRAALTGGTDPESQLDAIYRVGQYLHYRDVVVTARQYELFVENAMGLGSHATVVKDPTNPRNILVYCVGQNAVVPNDTELARIQGELEQKICLGTTVSVRPMNRYYVTLRAIVKFENYANPETAFAEWRAAVTNYFNVDNWAGTTVRYKELEYITRAVTGAKFVQGVYLFSESESPAAIAPAYLTEARDIELPNPSYIPVLAFAGLELVTDFGSYTYEYSPLPMVVESAR